MQPGNNPASQISVPTTIPSPQIESHTEGVDVVPPAHQQPTDTPKQLERQPGKAPASQTSIPITLLSPQMGEHIEGFIEEPPLH